MNEGSGGHRSRRVQLRCLGSGEALIDGVAASFRTRKTLGLLAFLALDPGPHPRESIADLLWPDADPAESRASLRTALAYLRQALGDAAPAVLIATRDTVGIAHGTVDLDVDALRRAAQLVRNGNDNRLRRQIRGAVDLYHGPFLCGLSLQDAPAFEAWLESQRAHWRGVAAELLSLLATMQLDAGEPAEALASLEQWTAIDPDDEAAWHRLIDQQLEQANLPGARRSWKAYCQTLSELDATPSKLMTDLYQRMTGSSLAKPQRAPGFSDLDLMRAPFVGRPREWAKVNAAYQRVRGGRTEVVVIAGQAGVGKTRLSSEFVSSVQIDADVMMGRSLGIGGLPYGPLIEALRSRLERENAPEDLLGDLWLVELSRLLPELLERYPDLVLEPADAFTRGRIFEAVTRLAIALARRKPVVLLIDDLQWADQDTRDLLQYAMQRWTETSSPVLLLLVAERPFSGDLERWFAAIEAASRTTWIELASLPPNQVAELVAMLAGVNERGGESMDTFSQWLAHSTGGSPRPIIQTLRGMLDKGLLHLRALNDSRWAIDIPDPAIINQLAFAGSQG